VMRRYPSAFAQWLQAADFALGPVNEIAIVGNPDEQETQDLRKVVWQNFRPRQVVAQSTHPPQTGSPALLHNRPLVNELSTAYVCQGFVCFQPVTTPEALRQQLG